MFLFNIKTKLFLVLVIVSIIPIIIVSLISYRSYTRLVNEQTSLVASTTIQNSVKNIEEILMNIDRISITLLQQSSNATNYTTVRDELRKLQNTDDQYEVFITRNKLKLIFENILLGYSYINGIYLFTPDGKNISYGNGTDLEVDYDPLEADWYKQTLSKKGELYIGEVNKKDYIINAKPSIGFSRALYDPNNNEFVGVFMLDLSTTMFSDLNRNPAPSLSNIYLANEKDNILYDKTNTLVGQRLEPDLTSLIHNMQGKQLQFNDGQLLTVIQNVPEQNWNVIATISIDKIYEQYGISQKLILYISISCAVIFLLVSFVLSTLITKPIIHLAKVMRKNKGQHFVTMEADRKRVDEIGILYHEYDKMMRDIDTHIRESYQSRILSMDSQMKALEAQINSHFLYNTLESINSIAEIEEVESIVIMTKALGDMFRYSIKTESELVPIQDELQHITNYMAIQQIRYGDKINCHLHIDESLKNQKILKLILQPLVENAIYHGLENKQSSGSITIKGYRSEDTLCFEVIDDGTGMTIQQIAEIHALLAEPPSFTAIGKRDKQSIGIKNVHARINLYYGKEYGLNIESEHNEGTLIKITVPYN
ncbi:sensor histidine kinase [Paenibacillus sp. FSL H8-0548]|uniref:sensor histidine kinase n=1 Tax=Paenibacillus sp. FSL H8-0548 TaxID=1920422 RepID=UPI00096F8182|nr:sensor histidine kinase [Paenibacillus sp. FSL H8-0548]OMF38072.1 sensor histidine kinase [Paenibacillus sp. FSL H8-0548]